MNPEDKTPVVPLRAMKGIRTTNIYLVPEILLSLLPGESLGEYRNRVIQATLEGRIGVIKDVEMK